MRLNCSTFILGFLICFLTTMCDSAYSRGDKVEDHFEFLERLSKENVDYSENQSPPPRPAKPIKGQNYSLIPWKTQDPENFLSFSQWMIESQLKEDHPDWELRLSHSLHKELMGKVLQCHGVCQIYRGTNSVNAQFQSFIFEGDEMITEKDSVAWIFLMDGSLMRISSESSVSFNEINFTLNEIFLFSRLNYGHLKWNPRQLEPYKMTTDPETDVIGLPLRVLEANHEFFERNIYKEQNKIQRRNDFFNLNEAAIEAQYNQLNIKNSSNHENFKASSHLILFAANMTIDSENIGLDLVYELGGKAYVKKADMKSGKFSLQLRGYLKTEDQPITSDQWIEVSRDGRAYETMNQPPGHLQILELLTRRIVSFELARQIWIEEMLLPILKQRSDPKLLAENFGYHLWGEEILIRKKFLLEYTRRIETTNLKSLDTLVQKLEKTDETVNKSLGDYLYLKSLNTYLLGLKKRYHHSRLRVREMDDLRYYIWILRNGRF